MKHRSSGKVEKAGLWKREGRREGERLCQPQQALDYPYFWRITGVSVDLSECILSEHARWMT